MRIKLTLRRPEDRLTDLEVTADATATVADVATALYLADPLRDTEDAPEGLTLQVQEPGARSREGLRSLDAGADLIQAGLRSGSVVSLARSSETYASTAEARGTAVALLRILSGPEAGREYPLPSGATTIGRSRDADIRIDDAMMSKRHARFNVSDAIEIADLGSANGLIVGGERLQGAALGPSDVVLIGDTQVSVIPLHRLGGTAPSSPVVEFNRSPRIVPRFPDEPVEIPNPPRRPQPIRFPFVMLIAPLFMGALLFAVRGSIFSLMFMVLMPLIAVAMYFDRKRQTRLQLEDQQEEFARGMVSAKKRITDAHDVERAVRLVENPSVADTVDAMTRMGRLLWTHRPEHHPFLTVRLGLGTATSRQAIDMPQMRDTFDTYREELLDLKQEYSWIAGVPIVADLRQCGALGVAGPGHVTESVARGLIVQIAGLHAPSEVVMAAITSPRSRAQWEWLKWLPHTTSPHSPLDGDHLADTPGRGTGLLARLEELVDARLEGAAPALRGPLRDDRRDQEPATPAVPAMVVIVEDDCPVDRARLVRLAERGADCGVHVLWCAPRLASLPAACRAYLVVDETDGIGTSGTVRLGERSHPVVTETVTGETALGLARHLAPLIDAGVPVDDDSDLPRSISYLRLTGTEVADDAAAVVERWKETGSLTPRDGSAPVRRTHDATLHGLVGHNGAEPFHLDLRTQGPHALVGGTTGAGKSEFLQAWVLGMALAHSPDRLTFLFVDYKGGAAFADCITLPHAVGLVTDLSPHLVRRALTSLRAELRHREHLLNRKKAKDLVSLERTGDPEAPPALVIMVDEFAALARDVPEFVDGVVDVAARGRSLGLHLVLATQRPAGVIKDNLRANTNLRIALRMADEPDSTDILGDKLAAHFDPAIPGRAAAKTGPGRISTFQTGYAGGWTADEPDRAKIDIVERAFGTGETWEIPAPQMAEEDPGPSDIIRLVSSLRAAAETAGVPAPRRPWLPEMATGYDLARLPSRRTDEHLLLGVMDLPASQSQPIVSYRPDRDGNMAVFGTGGSGKSTTLRTLAISAAITPRGGPVQVYGLDFGAGGLRMLDALPHVGSVISGDDEERVTRLLRTLKDTVEQRAADFAAVQAGSVAEYRERAGRPETPRILLLIDGMAAFREAYDFSALQKWFTTFVQIATDGRQLGVHVVVTGDRPTAVPNSLGSSIQRRLVLRMASSDDYLAFGEKKDVLDASSAPGRGILDGHEVQVAVLGGDSNVAIQGREIAKLADAMRRAGIPEAPEVERLSDDVMLADIRSVVDGRPVIGIADETLSELTVEPRGAFMITGPASSGRTSAVATLATTVRRLPTPMRTVRLSALRTPLAGLPLWDVEASDSDSAGAIATELRSRLDVGDVPESSMLIVIDGVADFSGGGAESELEKLVRSAARSGQFVVGESEATTWSQSYTLAQPFKAARAGIFLAPSEGETENLMGTAVGRVKRADFPPGRGFSIRNGRAQTVQIAQSGAL